MIYGIGIDLVNISRIERVISRWGDRFVARVFCACGNGILLPEGVSVFCICAPFRRKRGLFKGPGSGDAEGSKMEGYRSLQ